MELPLEHIAARFAKRGLSLPVTATYELSTADIALADAISGKSAGGVAIKVRARRPLVSIFRIANGSNVGSNGRSNHSQPSRISRMRDQDLVDVQTPHIQHLVAQEPRESVRVSSLLRHLVRSD